MLEGCSLTSCTEFSVNKPHVHAAATLMICLISDLLLSRQFVWTLSALCGSHVSLGFVYDRPRRSGEDGSAAKTECEYAGPITGKHTEHL